MSTTDETVKGCEQQLPLVKVEATISGVSKCAVDKVRAERTTSRQARQDEAEIWVDKHVLYENGALPMQYQGTSILPYSKYVLY